ncbi:uncharacterized protein LOC131855123 isoform X2 [Achroia grisella]|uniref:uncharacterized protein LOC131855123 isoform X2 n=1 Tax=Achroia grisella TaxID=688607 RepID=UPI0027D211B8|nr:uncharacterized protein LOC131855123 isoform X2 [Achroia grisella]
MTENKQHPGDPRSNVAKFGAFDPDKYVIDSASFTVRTNEALTPGCPPYLTQQTIGKFLQPLTRELVEVSPKPTIDELPDAVIDNMVRKDKAFWVDRPGTNAYTLHDAYYSYDMRAEIVKPPHQDVFPRSYQYELDCVKYRRLHTCDGLKQTEGEKQLVSVATSLDSRSRPKKMEILSRSDNQAYNRRNSTINERSRTSISKRSVPMV